MRFPTQRRDFLQRSRNWCQAVDSKARSAQHERGVTVDHATLYRWVQRYAPELEKRTLWYQNRISFSWRVDETYVRVKGRWKYLYRAIDKDGNTLDFLLSDRRDAKAAKRFLAKALRRSRDWKPQVINTDKNPAYSEAIWAAAERHPAPAGEVSQQPAGLMFEQVGGESVPQRVQ